MQKELISVVIPAFNEEKTIENTVTETIKVLNRIHGPEYEIIIIDDGSADSTSKVTRKLIKKLRSEVKLIRNSPNKGKGYTLKRGAQAARGDYILFMDADLEIHPDHLLTFLDIIAESDLDAVVGSKTARGSEIQVPLKRKIISIGYYFLLKLLFRLPVTDTQTGFKLFKEKPLKECIQKTTVSGYSFDLELLVVMKARKYRFAESPVNVDELRPRRISLRDSIPMLRDTLKIFRRYYFSRAYL